ncbi:MAG: hypothetical protein PHW53_01855 [Patescibacteria group bacterium]|nr:hypothetical protein [Patescibacteria group bacterium]
MESESRGELPVVEKEASSDDARALELITKWQTATNEAKGYGDLGRRNFRKLGGQLEAFADSKDRTTWNEDETERALSGLVAWENGDEPKDLLSAIKETMQFAMQHNMFKRAREVAQLLEMWDEEGKINRAHFDSLVSRLDKEVKNNNILEIYEIIKAYLEKSGQPDLGKDYEGKIKDFNDQLFEILIKEFASEKSVEMKGYIVRPYATELAKISGDDAKMQKVEELKHDLLLYELRNCFIGRVKKSKIEEAFYSAMNILSEHPIDLKTADAELWASMHEGARVRIKKMIDEAKERSGTIHGTLHRYVWSKLNQTLESYLALGIMDFEEDADLIDEVTG